jgi:hypothetical protein
VITSQILLWIAVIALAALVAGLARQVGIFQNRIAPEGVLTLRQKANMGDVSSPIRNFSPIAKGIFDYG